MKRIAFFGMTLLAVLGLASCKTTQNSYKQAYEKAVQSESAQSTGTTVVAAPVQAEANTSASDVASVPVREEKVTVVTGDTPLKAYGIVCGSFTLKTNADALRQRMAGDGYPAVVVANETGRTYRVVVNSFDDKASAVAARDAFKKKYPDNSDFQSSWILYKK